MQVKSTPFPHRTHTGVGPGVWGATHPPPTRGCPALACGRPLTCTLRKVVSAAPAPCEGSPSACELPPAPVPRSALRRGLGARPAASPAATGFPPAWHARPYPGGRRHLPARPGWPRSREREPARGAHVPAPARTSAPKPHPGRQQQQPRRPGPRHPRAAAHGRLWSPVGLPSPQLRRVQMPPPLPNRSPPL